MIEAILQQITSIPLYIPWRTRQIHLGQHLSSLRGLGLEFDQLKEYQNGEGMQKINWSATARRGGEPLLVNTYYEEKEMTVMLLVDLSASMHFGSTRVSKGMLVAEVSASLVYSALAARDRVGFLGFSSQLECYYPPKRSKNYQRVIPEAILSGGTSHKPVNFWSAVEALEQRFTIPALIFLCSDFLTDDMQQLARALARLQIRHDVVALIFTDPRETVLPTEPARLVMCDLETGEIRMYQCSSHNQQRMVQKGVQRIQHLHQLLYDLRVAQVSITPQSNYQEDIAHLFRMRYRRGFR